MLSGYLTYMDQLQLNLLCIRPRNVIWLILRQLWCHLMFMGQLQWCLIYVYRTLAMLYDLNETIAVASVLYKTVLI